jgi:hypothetical protein
MTAWRLSRAPQVLAARAQAAEPRPTRGRSSCSRGALLVAVSCVARGAALRLQRAMAGAGAAVAAAAARSRGVALAEAAAEADVGPLAAALRCVQAMRRLAAVLEVRPGVGQRGRAENGRCGPRSSFARASAGRGPGR